MKRISTHHRCLWIAACACILVALFIVPAPASTDTAEDTAPGVVMADQAVKNRRYWITTDHSRIEALQADFRSGEAITKACLSCHTEAADQFHRTIHWTWKGYTTEDGKVFGKAGDSLNNFCISTNRMADKSCLACHPGWGTETKAINCLNCHSSKPMNWEETFEDLSYFGDSDDPEEQEIAAELKQNLGASIKAVIRPGRQNCGGCHFKGGGGDGVKHGDLDTSLAQPNKALDVHMAAEGRNFNCTRCHSTTRHNIAGRVYTRPAATDRKSLIEDDLATKITCESCHSDKPHEPGSKINDHTDKVACQSCHIPEFARVNPTKMSWDWSKAGVLKDGKPFKEHGDLGKETYMSIKGSMTWAKNVKPEYYWYNGSISSITAKDTIDPGGVVPVSHPVGAAGDPNSRIFPFKVHKSRQPYDKVNKTLLTPLLSGTHGYWKTFDWPDALTRGSKDMDLPYSGQYDFVDTTYVFPITHMVAPREKAVGCIECHAKTDSRLAGLTGFYMPGRDRSNLLEVLGWALVLGSLFAVCIHGLTRMFTNGGKEKH